FRERDPLLSSAAVLRPGPGAPPVDYPRLSRTSPSKPRAWRTVRGPDRQSRLLEVHPPGGADVLRLPRTHRPLAGCSALAHAARNHCLAKGLPHLPRSRDAEHRRHRRELRAPGRTTPAADVRCRPAAAATGRGRVDRLRLISSRASIIGIRWSFPPSEPNRARIAHPTGA